MRLEMKGLEVAEDYTQHDPYKFLVVAVLDRAICDLVPYATSADRNDAIRWFQAYNKKCKKAEDLFSFAFCIDVLNLKEWQINFIFEKVNEALVCTKATKEEWLRAEKHRGRFSYLNKRRRVCYDKSVQKGEESRAGISELDESTRSLVG